MSDIAKIESAVLIMEECFYRPLRGTRFKICSSKDFCFQPLVISQLVVKGHFHCCLTHIQGSSQTVEQRCCAAIPLGRSGPLYSACDGDERPSVRPPVDS